MTAITVKRTIVRRKTRRFFRELARSYLAGERTAEFVVEALLFAIIVAISAWPIFEAIEALNQFLQTVPS